VTSPRAILPVGRIAAGLRNAEGRASFAVGMTGEGCPTVDSVVCVSSVGKPMAASCIGMLVLQGLLDPDAPAREWIPELPAWTASITVRHLIHHISGVPDKPIWDIGFAGTVPDWTNEAVIALLATMPGPQAEPGATFSYSSVGYILLGTIAERVTGQSMAQLTSQHIFAPLGMTSTQLWSGPSMHPPSVTFHPSWHDGVPMPRTSGDGGVWSTVRDLLRWADAMNTAALGDELTDLLHRQGRLNDGSVVPYAWGWFTVPDGTATAYAHGGWWPGCYTYVIHAPASGAATALVAFTDEPRPVEELGKQLAGIH
jgi:CubicO group peptidase (beta-lactamase class C family)